ncbi:MAG: hypothetical protein ABJN22_07080 [Litorimonas sp.]
MIFRYLVTSVSLTLLFSGHSFAQDGLFTINKSEVQSSWNDEGLDTEVSKIAIPSLQNGRKASIITRAGFDVFEQEALSLSQSGPDGLSTRTGNMLISMGFQGHVRNAAPPSWFDIYYPGGNVSDLSAVRPERHHGNSGTLEGKGFTPDGYFVADHIVNDITYARYYFKIIKDGRSYFQPVNNFDPANKTVTLWQKVKYNSDANSQYQLETERRENERQAAKLLAQQNKRNSPPQTSTGPDWSNAPTQPIFPKVEFGPAPLSKEMQEIVDAGKGQVEGVYETQRQCRLVADNDEVFIRSKKVCEDVQVLVGTRPVR